MTQQDVVAASNAAADAAGIPHLLLLAAGCAESGLDPFARRPADPADDERYWPDVSFGVWQQTIRWTAEYIKAISKSGGNPDTFPGAGTIEAIGSAYRDDVEYAAEVAAANLRGKYRQGEPDAVFRALCRYNWPAGDGEPASDATAANYRRGIAEATPLLGDAPMPTVPTYNLAYPIRTQDHDWDCFEESANWALHAAGRAPADAWLEQQMLADGVETTANGLEDGSGAQAAAWVARQYGDGSPALTATNAANVSFDDVKSVAGRAPVLLGGHHWGAAGHWTGVRGYDPTADCLVLANPGGNGPIYGWQTMSRQQFDSISPCSMVVVQALGGAPPAPVPVPVPAPAPSDELARLRAELADKTARLDAEVSKLGYISGDVATACDRVAEAATAIANTLRSLKPPAA